MMVMKEYGRRSDQKVMCVQFDHADPQTKLVSQRKILVVGDDDSLGIDFLNELCQHCVRIAISWINDHGY